MKLVFLSAENGDCIPMYRPCFWLLLISLISGCASIDTDRLVKHSSDRPDGTDRDISTIDDTPSFEHEREALFEQPYIDPLTEYLEQYRDDDERASVIRQVEAEQARRCEDIAAQYASEPPTETILQRYRAGYAYSCPDQVSAFAERVKRSTAEDENAPADASVTTTESKASKPADQQALADCYLLTSIRNYSAAREACLPPAEKGDTRSQANMALIAHAFEDYATALEWAEKAAPASRDACYLMGRMYASGHGVDQDMDRAIYWYSKAAGQGHREAKAELDRHREQENPVGDT